MAIGRISGRMLKDDLVRDTSLTFNTDTLVVDYTNGRIGIGTATPGTPLEVVGDSKLANVSISNNTISSTEVDADLILATNGVGNVSVSSTYIKNLADPEEDQDAATKAYVDTVIDNTEDRLGNLYVDDVTITSIPSTADHIVNAEEGLFIVDGTAGLVIPSGTTAERRDPATEGTLRYNTTIGQLEVYDGVDWKAFGIDENITNQALTGDGSTTEFTLIDTATTLTVLVSINGTLQEPVSAYSVTDTTLTFTEAPGSTDVIHVRRIASSRDFNILANGDATAVVYATDEGEINVTGSSTDFTGNLTVTGFATVSGNLTAGNISTAGTITGDIVGNITGDFVGNLTGDVTGDVTGNLTGDVTGNVTGDVTGDVTGNVTGALTGNVTGNVTASSVTVNGVEVATEADITSLSSSITDNANDIIELEEEIDALAPSFDRGNWAHDTSTGSAGASPGTGEYYIADGSNNITQNFSDTAKIYFDNTDSQTPARAIHTFSDVAVGQYVELFESGDSSFLLGTITTKTTNSGYTVFDIALVKAEGGPSLTGGVRVKFFELADPSIDLDGYMQTSGGTFTGDVKHKKDIIIEPTLPDRWINIKNKYATNEDGSDNGGPEGQGFGVNFDLDHGNSGYNTVKWTTRLGDILSIHGGTRAWAKYRGKIEEPHNLVNKHYVDNHLLKTGGQIDGQLTIKKDTQVPLNIIGDGNTTQMKVWSSGAVELPNYTAFQDNELVTKKYVDNGLTAVLDGATAFKFFGGTDVTGPAPSDPVEGQTMSNRVVGTPDPSWGLDTSVEIPINGLVVYGLLGETDEWAVVSAPQDLQDLGLATVATSGSYNDLTDAPTETVTLHSAGNSMYWTATSGPLTTSQWGTTSNSSSSNKKYYFNRLYTNTGSTVDASSYTTTAGSVLEVWKNGQLIIKTPIYNWVDSDHSSGQRMCTAGGYRVTTTNGDNFSTSINYGIIITNMKPV